MGPKSKVYRHTPLGFERLLMAEHKIIQQMQGQGRGSNASNARLFASCEASAESFESWRCCWHAIVAWSVSVCLSVSPVLVELQKMVPHVSVLSMTHCKRVFASLHTALRQLGTQNLCAALHGKPGLHA